MISAILPEHLDLVWEEVKPLLQKGVDAWPGRTDVIDLYAKILTKDLQLWVGYDKDGKIHSAGLTRIYDTPLARVLSIELLGGERFEDWEEEAFKITEHFASANKCTKMEIIGREAWKRFAAKYGYTKVASIFEKDI